MEITWYGHSCFRLRARGVTVITDPPGKDVGYEIPRLRADIVTVSLNQPDYANSDLARGNPRIITGPGEYEIKGVFITGIATPLKKEKGPEGLKNTIYLLEVEGVTVCHLGVLDHVPSQTQVQALGNVDVLLIPVGSLNTVNANQAAEIVGLIEPKIVIPMHFKTKATKLRLQPVSAFLSEMGLPETKPQEALDVTSSSLPGETKIVVLDYQH